MTLVFGNHKIEEVLANDVLTIIAEGVEPGLADVKQVPLAVDRMQHGRGLLVELLKVSLVITETAIYATQADI